MIFQREGDEYRWRTSFAFFPICLGYDPTMQKSAYVWLETYEWRWIENGAIGMFTHRYELRTRSGKSYTLAWQTD